MSSNANIPFGRGQTGRNPRWATWDVCLSHSCKPPAEDGVGNFTAPASSSRAVKGCRLLESMRDYSNGAWL